VGVATWEPFLFSGLRFAAAGTIVIFALRMRNVTVPREMPVLRYAVISGVLLLVGGNAAVVLAERYVPSGITAVMVSTMPIWTVMLAGLLYRDSRVALLTWIGLMAGMSGVVMLVWPALAAPFATNRDFLGGVVILQLGSISWALGSIYVSRHRVAVPPLLSAGLQMLAGGIVLIGIGTVRGEWARLAPDESGWQAFVYLLIFGSLLGYVAFVYALQHLPVAKVALYGYVNPIVAVIAGAVLLREHFGIREIAATVIILGAVALARHGADVPNDSAASASSRPD
jgi:drug/metabolite transporter (DMT)-like permease